MVRALDKTDAMLTLSSAL